LCSGYDAIERDLVTHPIAAALRPQDDIVGLELDEVDARVVLVPGWRQPAADPPGGEPQKLGRAISAARGSQVRVIKKNIILAKILGENFRGQKPRR
jgi:hypothetical protein